MEQIGVVIKEDGDFIEILATRESACGSDCSTCSAKCSESKPFQLRTLNTINAKPGERVSIQMNSKAVLSYMLLVYGLPLIFFLSGSLIASIVFGKLNFAHVELYSLISGIIIMAIAFVIVKRVDTKYKDVANNNLVIKKMV